MEPRIEILTARKLVGKRVTMTLLNNRTPELWRSFMPRHKEINNNLTADLFSMQVYKQTVDVDHLNQEFEKWAAIEVTDFNNIPTDMESFELSGGLYAVFLYKGLSTDTQIFQYIFGTWLSNSNYELDNRPHFETLGEKYKNYDPTSEEEIWIPVKQKNSHR